MPSRPPPLSDSVFGTHFRDHAWDYALAAYTLLLLGIVLGALYYLAAHGVFTPRLQP